MVQKAKKPITTSDRLKSLNDHKSTLYALNRFNQSPQTSATAFFANNGGAAGGSTAAAGNYLQTQGDTMIGPIAYYPATVSVNGSDELDISADLTSNIQSSSYVIASFGSPDTIQFIKGAQFAGQQLWLQCPAASTLTIEDYSNNVGGNIATSDGTDLVITTTTDPVTFTLIFDVTISPNSNVGGWVVLNAKAVTGGTATASFPLQYPINDQGTKGSGTITHNLASTTGHKLKVTLSGDITIDFSNIPSGTAMDWLVEVTQNGTGGHTITWTDGANFEPSLSLSETPDTTSLVAFHSDDGGSTIRVITLLNATTAAGTEVFTWTADHSADNLYDLNGLANLNFANVGVPNNAVSTIYSSIGADMIFNVATGKDFGWSENGIDIGLIDNGRFIIQTVTADGPDIILNNNDQTPLDNDIVGQIFFRGNDDALSNIDYGAIEVEMNDVSAGAIQASFKVNCYSDNSLDPIIDYSGSDATFRISSGVDVFRPNRDDGIALGSVSQSWSNFFIAGYEDVKQIAVPANPAAGTRRIFVDSADGILKVRTSGGTTTSLEGGGLGAHNILDATSHTDSATGTVARGDLITGQSATPKFTRLAKGTANQVLTMDGTATDIVWANAAAGDDLGDHTATESLKMASNNIEAVAELQLSSTGAIGGTTVGISQITGDMYFNCLTTDSFFFREQGTTVVEIDVDGVDIRSPGWLEMTEITAPTGLANHVRLYAQDNGAGKTQLMAIFGSGAAQQVAIEP